MDEDTVTLLYVTDNNNKVKVWCRLVLRVAVAVNISVEVLEIVFCLEANRFVRSRLGLRKPDGCIKIELYSVDNKTWKNAK